MKNERGNFGMALIFAVLFATLAFVSIGCASATTIYVPDNFSTIQQAVDNATANEIIIVRDGIYTENVDVNVNHLTIKSENGSASTIVQAASTSDHAFEVRMDYVNISGFNVTGATDRWKAGIHFSGADHCNVSNNTASNNWAGILLEGSPHNTLTSNTASKNSNFGIYVRNFGNNNTLTSNIANSNGVGISLYYVNNNTLTSNTASNNTYGIHLYSSSNNLIYNNYFNNLNNAYDNGNNTWNITKIAGTNIIDGPYLGGNYWSDYNGDDLDGDGLGDTMLPYNSSGNIANGGDYRPLATPALTPTPTPSPTPTPTPTPEATTVSISPPTKTVSPGPFTVNITVEPEVPIAGVQFDLSFDPSLVRVNNVTEGNLLKQSGTNTYFYSGTIDNAAGTITCAASAITTPGETVSTPSVFATIQMTAKSAAGTSTFDLSNVIVGDINGNAVAIAVNDGSVRISTAPWDVNGDGFVNILDMILVGQHFGETGAPGWIPEDVNCDGVIDVRDMLP